jgi:hypothetical protein
MVTSDFVPREGGVLEMQGIGLKGRILIESPMFACLSVGQKYGERVFLPIHGQMDR